MAENSSFQLFRADVSEIEDFLKNKKWLDPKDHIVSAEKAGEGNMNCTLRVQAASHSIILKQSYPYVYKYPQISAPIERVFGEKKFYEWAQDTDLNSFMPHFLGSDEDSHVIALSDLGNGA